MLKKLLSLLGDVAVYGISSLLSQLIGFLLLPLYTRYLTPADLGEVRMVLVVTSLFAPLANLGMVNAIFRRFNIDKSPSERGQVLSTGLLSVTLSSLSLMLLGFMFAGSLSRLGVGDDSLTNLIRLNLVTSAAVSIGAVPLAILRADRRVKTVAIVNVAKLVLSVGCTIWLVVVRQMGPWGVVTGTLVGEVTLSVVQFAMTFHSLHYWPTTAMWRKLSSYGLPFVPHQIQGMLMLQVPQFAVGRMLGLDEIGLYDVALKFTVPLVFVINAVQSAWVAYKFQIHAEDDDPAAFFRTAVTYYVAGLVYLWVGVSLWGPEGVRLMTEASFHPAAALIPIAGLIPVSQGLYFMLGTGLELSDDMRVVPLITLAGLIVACLVIYPAILSFGAAGAAVATICSFVTLTVVVYYFAQRRFVIHYDWTVLSLLIGLGVVAMLLGHGAQALATVPRVAVVAAISLAFPLVEFAVLCRSSTERHRMRILASKFAALRRRRPAV